MKKYVGVGLFVLAVLIAIFMFNFFQSNQSATLKLSENFCIKAGESFTGETILKSSDFTDFLDSHTVDMDNNYHLFFYLTPDGQKILSEKTKELKGKTLSVWIGNELIATPVIDDQITGDSMDIIFDNTTDAEMKSIVNKLKAK